MQLNLEQILKETGTMEERIKKVEPDLSEDEIKRALNTHIGIILKEAKPITKDQWIDQLNFIQETLEEIKEMDIEYTKYYLDRKIKQEQPSFFDTSLFYFVYDQLTLKTDLDTLRNEIPNLIKGLKNSGQVEFGILAKARLGELDFDKNVFLSSQVFGFNIDRSLNFAFGDFMGTLPTKSFKVELLKDSNYNFSNHYVFQKVNSANSLEHVLDSLDAVREVVRKKMKM